MSMNTVKRERMEGRPGMGRLICNRCGHIGIEYEPRGMDRFISNHNMRHMNEDIRCQRQFQIGPDWPTLR